MADRFALFLPTLDVGGAERVNVNLANELASRGYAVDVLVARTGGDLAADLDDEVDVVDVGSRFSHPWPELYAVPGLRAYVDDREPDAVLSSLALANVVASVARTLSRHSPRLVLSVHAPPARQDGLKYRLSYSLGRRAYAAADRVLAVSEGVKTEVCEGLRLGPDAVDVVYNPIVDEELLRASERPVDHAWFDGDVPVVLTVGSLKPMKEQGTLVRAFDALLDERDARLVLIGDGNRRAALEEQVDDLGIASKVAFLGERRNPYRYMAAASVFAMSSRYEGLPSVLIEALACGCPVVSTACPYGPAEILEDGAYGRLVPVGDAESLADAIAATLDDDVDPAVLKRRAADFSVSRIADEYEAVLTGR